jgi:putative transposase
MKKSRRVWSTEQKLRILQEADQIGLTELFRKYDLSSALYHRWKREFHQGGLEGLQSRQRVIDPEFKALQQENDRLKRIIANQALELEFKTELLKKSH